MKDSVKKYGIVFAIILIVGGWFLFESDSKESIEDIDTQKSEKVFDLGINSDEVAKITNQTLGKTKGFLHPKENIECKNADECFAMAKEAREQSKSELKKTIQEIESACLEGSGYSMSCVVLGYMHSQEIPLLGRFGISKDYSKSNALFDKACQMGNNFGCSLLASAYSEGNGVGINKNKAQTLLKKAQRYGKLESLANNMIFMFAPFSQNLLSGKEIDYRNVGLIALENEETMRLVKTALGVSYMFDFSDDYKMDIGKSRFLLEESCKSGESLSCDILGVLVSKGWMFHQDEEQSIKFFEKSCQNKDSIGCMLLAKNYQDGKNKKEGEKLFKEAQYGFGSLEGVLASYASSLYQAINPTQNNITNALKSIPLYSFITDDPNKIEIIKTSCKNGSVIDCNILGAYYLVSKEKESKKEGFELVERNCKNGDNFGCTILGLNYQFGLYSSVDLKKAKSLFEKTQKNGSVESVANTGLRFAFYALKAMHDDQDIGGLMQLSCQNGLQAECDAQKFYDVFKLYKRSQSLFDKSCEMGKKEACN